MENTNSVPINISGINRCIAIPEHQSVTDGNQIVMENCGGGSNQIFNYDPITKEIKYGNKCVDLEYSNTNNGTKVQLWNCNNTDAQKWNFANGSITTQLNNNKCMNVNDNTHTNNGITINDCNGGANQQFNRNIVKQVPSKIPRIIRNNINIPPGTFPAVQLAVLPPHSAMFVNPQGKNVMVRANGNTVINNNGKELQCIGSINEIVIGPLTIMVINFYDQSGKINQMQFRNGSFEHDFIYNTTFSFSESVKSTINNVASYNISREPNINIKKVMPINQNIQSGQFFVSNNASTSDPKNQIINMNNFVAPNRSLNVTSNTERDYILGPFTLVTISGVNLYNSGSRPLYYNGVTGVSITNGAVSSTIASPLNSGYAVFTANCDFTGTSVTAMIGHYNFSKNLAHDTTENQGAPTNPVDTIGNDKISGVIVGPYTKVILYADANYTGSTKVFENNSPNEVRYNLCAENFNDLTSSIKIEYAGSYVGYGLVTRTPKYYKPTTFEQSCGPDQNNLPGSDPNTWAPINGNGNLPGSDPDTWAPINGNGNNLPGSDPDTWSPFIYKESNHSQTLNINDLRHFNMDCGNNGLSSFKLTDDNGSYYEKYTCDARNKNYSTRKRRSHSVAPHSLNNLVNVNIDCGLNAITGVKTTVVGNRIRYEYMCGDQPLGNITTHHTKAHSGSSMDLFPLLNQEVKCTNGYVTGFRLKSHLGNRGPNDNTYRYMYTYKCGKPNSTNIPIDNGIIIDDDGITIYDTALANTMPMGGSNSPAAPSVGPMAEFAPLPRRHTVEFFGEANIEDDPGSAVVDISYKNNDGEYHSTCPSGYYRSMRLPAESIQIDGDGVAVDLRQASGKIDTVVLKGQPITVKNQNYIGVGVKPIHTIENFTTGGGGCLDWFHIVLLLVIIFLFYIAQKKRCFY